MIRWILAFILTGTSSVAETVMVRTGEHEDFSRVVFSLREPSEWELGRSNDGYKLKFSRLDINFDLGLFFYYIPRTRLTAVETSGEAELQLSVADNVYVDVLQIDSRTLVLDFLNGSANPDSQFELPFGSALQSPNFADKFTNYNSGNHDVGLGIFWRNLTDFKSAQSKSSDFSPSGGPRHSIASIETDERQKRISAAEEELAAQMARASSQGLIEPHGAEIIFLKEVYNLKEKEAENSNATLQAPPLKSEPPMRIAINSHVKNKQSVRNINQDNLINSIGEECFSDADLNIDAWRGEESGISRLGAIRQILIGEFDIVNPEGVGELAKFYLSLGWGAEAIAIFKAFEIEIPEDGVFFTLATILEEKPVPHTALIRQMLACDSAAALWAVLANDEPSYGVPVHVAAVKRSFSELPFELRKNLGPRLADLLIRHGEIESAYAIGKMIARGSSGDLPTVEFIDALSSVAAGNSGAVLEKLREIISKDRGLFLDALILSIEATLKAGLPVSEDTLWRISDAALEYRDSQVESSITQAHILSSGSLGRFDIAFDIFGKSLGFLDPKLRINIATHLAEQILSITDETTFLQVYFAYRDELFPESLRWGIRSRLAEKLLMAGFPHEAERLIGFDVLVNEDARLLLARAALAERNVSGVTYALEGLSGTDADLLRAAAFSLDGNYAAAQKLFETSGVPDKASVAAWRAGNWNAVGDNGSPGQRSILERQEILTMQSSDMERGEDFSSFVEIALDDVARPLEAGRLLVERSQLLRQQLDKLLQESE